MLNSLKSLVDKDIFSLLTPKRQLVGLDIGSSGIKLVQLKENRGRYVLQKFGFKPLEPEVIVDGTVMDEGQVVSAIKALFDELNVKVKQVAVSISGHAVIIKKISFLRCRTTSWKARSNSPQSNTFLLTLMKSISIFMCFRRRKVTDLGKRKCRSFLWPPRKTRSTS